MACKASSRTADAWWTERFKGAPERKWKSHYFRTSIVIRSKEAQATFLDREEAARQFAGNLKQYRGRSILVLAIPRGAVPLAMTIANKLDANLDVDLVRKLRAPRQPELAIGSVDETGWTYVAENAPMYSGTPEYPELEWKIQMDLLLRRREIYTPECSPLTVAGRVVIVVDDGLATGATMIAALHSVRVRHPEKYICAIPVAPSKTVEKVTSFADEKGCLKTPENFQAVGNYYRFFPQIEDIEVIDCHHAPRPDALK
jgi:putative phosphoribosyl transferase